MARANVFPVGYEVGPGEVYCEACAWRAFGPHELYKADTYEPRARLRAMEIGEVDQAGLFCLRCGLCLVAPWNTGDCP